MDDADADGGLEAAIFALLAARAPGATICPSEAARAVAPGDWRPLMPRVRRVAARLARAGRLEVRQRGAPVDPDRPPPGPVRLALPPGA